VPEPEPTEEQEEQGGTTASEEDDGTRWYALQTYSGHENKVKKLIEQKIQEQSGEENPAIHEVIIPTHEVVEIKGGKKVQKEKRLYPGYVLVRMVFNRETRHMLNNVQGVIRFVGGGDSEPQPLSRDEINKILGVSEELEEEGPEEEVPFHTGQAVEIKEGPFSDFSGTVEEVFADKGKVRVEVSLFGRPTSVELDFTQLEGY